MQWSPAMQLFGISYLILVLKMVAIGGYTSYLRIRSGVYATPEDNAFHKGPVQEAAREDIERARRAHRNDLENILPFFGVGLLYAFTNPGTTVAAIYFLGFTVARIAHTILYVKQRQPHRTIAFGIGQALMVLMTLTALIKLL